MTSLILYTPAGVLAKAAPLKLAARRLKKLGFDVAIDEAALAKHQRFAATTTCGWRRSIASRARVRASRSPRAAATASRACSIASTGHCWPRASRPARAGSATAT